MDGPSLRHTAAAERCSVVAALDAIGDGWSFLVLRELFFGVRRFNDIQRDLGISRSVLAARLERLTELGVVRTERYQRAGERARNEYRLTRKGVGLLPAIVALREWGDDYANPEPAVTIVTGDTDEPVRLEFRTPSGRRVAPHEMRVRPRTPADAAIGTDREPRDAGPARRDQRG